MCNVLAADRATCLKRQATKNIIVALFCAHHLHRSSCTYRQGSVLIFMNSFLAVFIKADIAGGASHSAFGGGLVAVNLILILAVLWAVRVAMREVVDDSSDEDNNPSVSATTELQ